MKKTIMVGFMSILVAGCASNNLYFGTATSVGVDVVGTPASPVSASLAYKRTEVTFSEQEKGKQPYSVLGALDMNVDFFAGTIVVQHFATGEAAEYAALVVAPGLPAVPPALSVPPVQQNTEGCTDDENSKFLFVTGTSIGVDFDASKADPHALIGYKRVENAYIPVCKKLGSVGSVYSNIKFDSKSDTQSKFFSNTHISQSFATGKAANIMASRSTLAVDATKK